MVVGAWAMADDVRGTVTYAWMDGGCRIQDSNLQQQDRPPTQGMEMIGQLQRSGEEPGTGELLDDVDEDTLTIWFGARVPRHMFTEPSATMVRR
jgi:hypothetical protein